MPADHALTATVAFVAIGAGVLHASWNAVAKQFDDKLVAFALVGVSSTVGGAVTLAATGLPAGAAIPFVIGSGAIHIAYYLALMSAYRLGAFNQTYPIARGTSPLVIALGAYLIAGEGLAPLPLVGVLVLGAGLTSLAFTSRRVGGDELPAIAAALLTGLTIAAYSLVDGLGVRRAGDPFAYAGLLFLIQGPTFAAVAALRRGAAGWGDRATCARGIAAGTVALVAYGLVLWAQTRAPLAEVAALRETSVIVAALIGLVFFHEGFGARRLAAAAAVAAGVILIAL